MCDEKSREREKKNLRLNTRKASVKLLSHDIVTPVRSDLREKTFKTRDAIESSLTKHKLQFFQWNDRKNLKNLHLTYLRHVWKSTRYIIQLDLDRIDIDTSNKHRIFFFFFGRILFLLEEKRILPMKK